MRVSPTALVMACSSGRWGCRLPRSVFSMVPIGDSWLACNLAAVSGIARKVHAAGQPLTREHVFSEEVRYRYIQQCTHMTDGSRNLMWTRLELLSDFLNNTTPGRVLRKPTITEEAPLEPLTPEAEADLWIWVCGLRPMSRRHRIKALVALGLGCGLTGGEVTRVAAEHVFAANDGVHVQVTSKKEKPGHLVTCRADWEDRLAELAAQTKPGHFLLAPWRDTPPKNHVTCESLRRAMKKDPPVLFNSTRLRNTWLCHHLADGTPLKVLMEAAGMKEANHLHNLLRLLPPTDPTDAKRALRGFRGGGGG